MIVVVVVMVAVEVVIVVVVAVIVVIVMLLFMDGSDNDFVNGNGDDAIDGCVRWCMQRYL